MAHYAKLSETNEVHTVLTLADKDEQNEAGETVESLGQAYLEKHNNWPAHLWKKCSYNTRNGQHLLGGTPFRGNYPAKNFIYDSENDIFKSKQPYASWVFNSTSHQWEPPVAPPQTFTTIDGKEVPDMYDWNESNQSWDKKPTDYPSI